MKTYIRRRLARLEGRRVNSGPNESDLRRFKFKSTIMSIVAFHAGEWAPGDSLATALARGLDITAVELKNALKPNSCDRRDIWVLVLEKLNDLIVARGGRSRRTVRRSSKDRARMTFGATVSKCSTSSMRKFLRL
jgi:hypothetical protein